MNRHSTLVELPREARLAAHREPRDTRRPVRDVEHRQPAAHEPGRARRQHRSSVTRRRSEAHRWAHPLQRHGRGDPHRSPEPLSGHDRGVRQPAALRRRQPADAGGDANPRRERLHRRVHDRNGETVRLRAAGHHAVREVRGNLLQLRLPQERLPAPPARSRPARRAAARAGDPRPTRRGARLPRRRNDRAAARGREHETATTSRPRSRTRWRATRSWPPSRRWCSTARSGRRSRTARRRRPALWPMAIRCAQKNPDGVERAGFGSAPDAGNRLFDAIVDRPPGSSSPTTPGRRRGSASRPTTASSTLDIPELLDELAELSDRDTAR